MGKPVLGRITFNSAQEVDVYGKQLKSVNWMTQDISKCGGAKGYAICNTCWRKLCPPSGWQSYTEHQPNSKGKCDNYMPAYVPIPKPIKKHVLKKRSQKNEHYKKMNTAKRIQPYTKRKLTKSGITKEYTQSEVDDFLIGLFSGEENLMLGGKQIKVVKCK